MALQILVPLGLTDMSLPSQPVLRPQCTNDWESRKTIITQLYASQELKGLIRTMEEKEGFKATYIYSSQPAITMYISR